MNRVPSAAAAPTDPTIADGFGSRTRGVDSETGDEVELKVHQENQVNQVDQIGQDTEND